MKKIITLAFLCFSIISFAQQKGSLGIHMGCYSNGDTLTMEAIKKVIGINILGEGSEKCSLKQWNMAITFKNKKTHIFKPLPKTPTTLSPQMRDVLTDKFNAVIKIVIQDVVISYFDKIENKNAEMSMDPITFYASNKAFKKCDERTALAKDDLLLKFSCFKNGDVATVKDLLHYPTFSIINYNPKVDVRILSFNFAVPKMDARRNPNAVESINNDGIELNAQSFEMAKKLNADEEFVLDNIKIEFSNRKTKTKEVVTAAPVHIKIARKSTVECGDPGSDTLLVLEYAGKLLTGKDKNKPLVGQKVYLRDGKDTIVAVTVTNSYGDFTFRNLKADEYYNISVPAVDNPDLKDQTLYLAKVDGTIIKSFERSGNTFVYQLLPTELFTLSKEVAEDDTELKIKNFGKSTQNELIVVEDVYYAPNSYEINDLSIAQLDKIINAMNQNMSLKLSISSHTDANGDDAYNMSLSEKRAKKVMEYIVGKGIAADRLKAKGYGETMIKNRCKNGVDCSELEHELNRRTEFKFTK